MGVREYICIPMSDIKCIVLSIISGKYHIVRYAA